MDFESYKHEFVKQAMNSYYSEAEINTMINYAKNLYDRKIPIIFDVVHFSLMVGIDLKYLYKVSNSQGSFYRKFEIRKSNGRLRLIREPLPTLKQVQYWILENILNVLPTSVYSKAFKRNSSIKHNARFHQNQKVVICMDIENYFGSITEFQVYDLFLNLGYNQDVSTMLGKLCCLNNSLPQGAPTSPALSNLITQDVDDDLATLAKELSSENGSVRYTRYADDITFSGNYINCNNVIKRVQKILKDYGFYLNNEKTRVLGRNNRQLVTGIVVNEKMQVSKSKRREIRAIMYFINKFGIESHMNVKEINTSIIQYLNHLLGVINFVLYINPLDGEFVEYKEQLYELIKENS